MKATQDMIMSINSDISNLSYQIRENQEKIHLLQKCHAQLSNEQEDFIANKRLIHQPELDSSVWNGKNAERFNRERNEMEQEMSHMSDLVDQQLHDITSKINALESANGTLSSTISSKKFQLSNLK
ncbi:YwqH-like family protein [Fictibacillus barbaricus]|uniref:Uncharacterized protein YukE n=1 Tax=Fictibacillus barbaricus TaxID=182136 RepID=A0ABU1U4L8_9BACL|nr:DUF5082 family protein [Fictibacillus barbaricus]MDR7074425.1 uncharacterized protein YukE [Fictibacillus barbaricus]